MAYNGCPGTGIYTYIIHFIHTFFTFITFYKTYTCTVYNTSATVTKNTHTHNVDAAQGAHHVDAAQGAENSAVPVSAGGLRRAGAVAPALRVQRQPSRYTRQADGDLRLVGVQYHGDPLLDART